MENRMNRMELAMILKDAVEKKLKVRGLKPLQGSRHCYFFMPLTPKNWSWKEKELELRCLVARKENPEITQVIGIGIGVGPNGDSVFDLAYIDIPELSNEVLREVEMAKNELGFFKNPVESRSKDMRR